MGFSATLTSRSDEADLAVSGEVDAFTALQLRRPVIDALTRGCRHFTVDLGEVTFIDAGGLGAFVALRNAARHANGSLTLVEPSASFRRTCGFAGLTDAFVLA